MVNVINFPRVYSAIINSKDFRDCSTLTKLILAVKSCDIPAITSTCKHRKMHKLFKTSHEFYNIVKKKPKFLTPNLHFHNSTQNLHSDSRLGFVCNELEELQSSNPNAKSSLQTQELSSFSERNKALESTVQISHPWPEWVDLMECLLRKGYFDGNENPFNSKSDEMGSKVANSIRTACLNFARDRYSLIRYGLMKCACHLFDFTTVRVKITLFCINFGCCKI